MLRFVVHIIVNVNPATKIRVIPGWRNSQHDYSSRSSYSSSFFIQTVFRRITRTPTPHSLNMPSSELAVNDSYWKKGTAAPRAQAHYDPRPNKKINRKKTWSFKYATVSSAKEKKKRKEKKKKKGWHIRL